jgi:hypothetical protein
MKSNSNRASASASTVNNYDIIPIPIENRSDLSDTKRYKSLNNNDFNSSLIDLSRKPLFYNNLIDNKTESFLTKMNAQIISKHNFINPFNATTHDNQHKNEG